MPDARCTRGLVCEVVQKKLHTSIQGSGEHPTFPAQWLYGLYVLSPVSYALLPPSPANGFASLAPALRRQDHTISPYASAPLVCTACVPLTEFIPPCNRIPHTMPLRPPHPIPTFGDDGQRPFLRGQDGESHNGDLGFG